jgi:hypothetical protein
VLRFFAGGVSSDLNDAHEAFQAFTSLVSAINEATKQNPVVVPIWPTKLSAIKCSSAEDIITGMVIKTVDAFQSTVVKHGLQTLLELSGWGSHITSVAQMHMHDMPVDMYMLKRALCMTRDVNTPVPPQYVCYNMEVLQKHASMCGGSRKTYFHPTLVHVGGLVKDNEPLSTVPSFISLYNTWVFSYVDKNGVYASLIVDKLRKRVLHFVPRVSSLDALKEAKSVVSKFTQYVSHTFRDVEGAKPVVAFFNHIPRSAQVAQFLCENSQGIIKLESSHSAITIGHFSHVWTIAIAELCHEGIDVIHLPRCIQHAKYEVHMLYRCILHAVTSPHLHIDTPPQTLITTQWRPFAFMGVQK